MFAGRVVEVMCSSPLVRTHPAVEALGGVAILEGINVLIPYGGVILEGLNIRRWS